MKKIVIALGGNALGQTNEEQVERVKKVSKKIVSLVEKGHSVIITHGNGPQVGMINESLDNSDNKIPFAECNAMSQGYIGYHLEQAINNELSNKEIDKHCVSITTEVLVSKSDKAFSNPTKPIGRYVSAKEAEQLTKEKGYVFKKYPDNSYRRVVPSPMPKEIVPIKTIKDIIHTGNIIIACGGGGIPVIKQNNKLIGIDAVIDKDLSSALLAKEINADMFIILTDVENACINFGKSNEEKLTNVTISEINKYIKNNEFSEGSMLPKIKACKRFVEETNNKAIITSLDKASEAVEGTKGTIITNDQTNNKNNHSNQNIDNTLMMFELVLAIALTIVMLLFIAIIMV